MTIVSLIVIISRAIYRGTKKVIVTGLVTSNQTLKVWFGVCERVTVSETCSGCPHSAPCTGGQPDTEMSAQERCEGE